MIEVGPPHPLVEEKKAKIQVHLVDIWSIEMKAFQINLPTFIFYLNFEARSSTVNQSRRVSKKV